MKPGKKLDFEIAEKVMGWKLWDYENDAFVTDPSHYKSAMNNDGWNWNGDTENREAHEFSPSTDLTSAEEIVNNLSGKGFKITVSIEPKRKAACVITFNGELKGLSEAKTASEAISMAALSY